LNLIFKNNGDGQDFQALAGSQLHVCSPRAEKRRIKESLFSLNNRGKAKALPAQFSILF
jgi:hypothetical protein